MMLELMDHPDNQIGEDGSFPNPNMDHFLLKKRQQIVHEKDPLESYTMRKQELESYLKYIGLDGITLAGKDEQKTSNDRYEIYQLELKKPWHMKENESIKEIAIIVPSIFQKAHCNDPEFQKFMKTIKLKVGTIQTHMERKHVVLDRRGYYGTIIGRSILIGAAALALGIGIKEHFDSKKRQNMMYQYYFGKDMETPDETYESIFSEDVSIEIDSQGKTR